MAIRVIGGANQGNLLRTTARPVNDAASGWTDPRKGDLCQISKSGNWTVNQCPSTDATKPGGGLPYGKVVSVAENSRVLTVEWYNVRAVVNVQFSTAPARGSSLYYAKSTVQLANPTTAGTRFRVVATNLPATNYADVMVMG